MKSQVGMRVFDEDNLTWLVFTWRKIFLESEKEVGFDVLQMKR